MTVTAASQGYLLCDGCYRLNHAGPEVLEPTCARCGTALHARKPASLACTWAYLLAAAILYIPAAVIWECGLLARASRINLRRTVRGFFDDLFSNPAYQPYDLTSAQVFIADETRINRDPFDALICAAAIDLELPLITRDADIRGAGVVKVIW